MKNKNLFEKFIQLDISKTDYHIDAIQDKLLERYLEMDKRFKQSFNSNLTGSFIEFLKEKARLKEPFKLSVIGNSLSGKSYSMISVAGLVMAINNKKLTQEYICNNQYDFTEKIQKMPNKDLKDTCFLIDRRNLATHKEIKVDNILFSNNISTIIIGSDAFSEGDYGLKAFGRDFKTKTVRFMLYNFQESSTNHLPIGMVYLPIFTAVPYLKNFEKDYLAKKEDWIENEKKQEQRAEGDILLELFRKTARKFASDTVYNQIKEKQKRIIYLELQLGSEWTQREIEKIEITTELMRDGMIK
jgi:hypothetical protein